LVVSCDQPLTTEHSLFDFCFALAAEARAAFFRAVMTGAGRLTAARADELELVDLDARLALHDAALLVLAGVRLGVLLEEVHPLDDRRALGAVDAEDLPALAGVAAREDDDGVALLDVRRSEERRVGKECGSRVWAV